MVSSRLYPQTLDKPEKNWRTNPLAYFATKSVIEEKSFITLSLGTVTIFFQKMSFEKIIIIIKLVPTFHLRHKPVN